MTSSGVALSRQGATTVSARFARSDRRLGERIKKRLDAVAIELGPGVLAVHQIEQPGGLVGLSGGRRKERDPLWLYPWGPAVGVEERLEAMKREVSTP